MNHYKAMDFTKICLAGWLFMCSNMRGNYWGSNFDITWMSSTGHVCSDNDMGRKIGI